MRVFCFFLFSLPLASYAAPPSFSRCLKAACVLAGVCDPVAFTACLEQSANEKRGVSGAGFAVRRPHRMLMDTNTWPTSAVEEQEHVDVMEDDFFSKLEKEREGDDAFEEATDNLSDREEEAFEDARNQPVDGEEDAFEGATDNQSDGEEDAFKDARNQLVDGEADNEVETEFYVRQGNAQTGDVVALDDSTAVTPLVDDDTDKVQLRNGEVPRRMLANNFPLWLFNIDYSPQNVIWTQQGYALRLTRQTGTRIALFQSFHFIVSVLLKAFPMQSDC
jgi:hypothetical protein